MRIFDAWVNLNPPERAATAWAAPVRQSLLRQFHETADLMRTGMSVETLIQDMDDAKVSAALLTNHPFVDTFDELMAACDDVRIACDRYPERFFGSGRVDVLLAKGAVVAAARAVERMVTDFRFKAVRVVPAVVELPPDHRAYYPVYLKACELGVPVTLNVGLPGPSRPAEVQRVLALDRVCLDFPELTVVATHLGFPWHDELLGLMIKHANLFMMTSAWAPKYYPASVVAFIKASRSRDRVMFASDYPVLSITRAAREIGLLDLDETSARCFLWQNAHRVFKLPGGDEVAHG